MMVTGWHHPEPEKELERIRTRIAALEKAAKQGMCLDDHTQDEIWRLGVKAYRLLDQLNKKP